jgi:hypothetical protein
MQNILHVDHSIANYNNCQRPKVIKSLSQGVVQINKYIPERTNGVHIVQGGDRYDYKHS